MSVAYIGNQSEKLRKKLSLLLVKYFIDVDFKLVLVNKFIIGSLFPFMFSVVRNPIFVVYEFCCSRCESKYIETIHTDVM